MNEIIFHFLNNFAGHNYWFDTLVIFCAQWLPFWLVGVFLFFHLGRLYFSRSKNSLRNEPLRNEVFRKVSVVFGSTFLVWGVSQIINIFYYSPRPFVALSNINILFTHGGGDSFPSGHATFFFALAMMSYYYSPRWLYYMLIVGAVVVSFARVIAGVHWPFDILGGFILAYVGIFVIRKLLPKRYRS